MTDEDDTARARRLDLDPRVAAELKEVRIRLEEALAKLLLIEQTATVRTRRAGG